MNDLRPTWPSWLREDPDAYKFRRLTADEVYETVERKAIKNENH